MTKPLKIFVDAHCFDGSYQGSSTFIRGIYTILSHQKETDIYLGAFDTKKLQGEFPDIPDSHFFKYQSKNPLIRIGREIPYILKKHSFDFAHFQYIAPFFKPCKFIVTTHDLLFLDYQRDFPWSYTMMRRHLFKRSCQKADIRTTPSVYSQKEINKHYHIPEKDICIIPNGVDECFFDSAIDRTSALHFIEKKYGLRNYVLYVSRIEPRKNHALLLRLFLEMQLYKSGISLVFIGEESLRVNELQKVKNQIPEDAVSFFRHLPQVGHKELLWFYKAARFVVYPSRAEGFGIPPLEAAAMKVPVLCANSTAMAAFNFFGDGRFDPENKDDFYKKFNQMLLGNQDNGRLQNISDTIHHEYSWEKSACRLWASMEQNNQMMA